MTAKSNKEWETENSELQEKLIILKQNFEKLSAEHKTLQTEKRNPKCKTCEKNPGSKVSLKKHKTVHEPSKNAFKCDECAKDFNEEWMLSAHLKTHKKYKCEKCDKSFKYLDIKKKHVLIQHENTKLYCHFYNNEKTCPFDDECIFLHEDSKFCKYDLVCERNFCMFKHRKIVETEKEDEIYDIETTSDSINVDEIEEEDGLENSVNDTVNRTFINHSQDNNSEKMFKCEICEFRALKKSDVNNHKTKIHNWCPTCFSSFVTQERLIKHTTKKHNNKL
jgi:hypothetical protein